MGFTVHIQEEAQQDIQDAFDWYEEQLPGLGDRFLYELYYTLDLIAEHPHHYSFAFADFRDAALRKFPYLVTFITKGHHVFINSIRHTKRKPKGSGR